MYSSYLGYRDSQNIVFARAHVQRGECQMKRIIVKEGVNSGTESACLSACCDSLPAGRHWGLFPSLRRDVGGDSRGSISATTEVTTRSLSDIEGD